MKYGHHLVIKAAWGLLSALALQWQKWEGDVHVGSALQQEAISKLSPVDLSPGLKERLGVRDAPLG